MLRVDSAVFVLMASAALMTSCRQTTAVSNADRADALLTIGAPQMQSSGVSVNGAVPLVIANTGVTTMFYSICGTTLERSVAGEWRVVYFVVCALGPQTDDLEIPPQSQRTVQFPVLATLGYGVADQWKPPVAGAYRLRAALRTNSKGFVRVTDAFQLGT